MTTITIKNDAGLNFSKTSFQNSRELLDFLIEKFEVQTSWTVADEDLSNKDLELINQAKKTEWNKLQNI